MTSKIEQQLKHNDCGISAVKIIYNVYDIKISRDFIAENIFLDDKGSSIHDLKNFFDKQSFNTTFNLLDLNSLKFNTENLKKYLPCILPIKSNQGQHYVVIKSIRKNKLEVLDPAAGQLYRWTFTELLQKAYSATANYNYVSNSQLFKQIIAQELEPYNIHYSNPLNTDDAEVINKLTYFTYLKENFGFKNEEAEKGFLNDLLYNQEISTLPKQFRTLKVNGAMLRITAPVVLTVQKRIDTKIPSPENTEPSKKENPYRRLVYEMKAYHKLWTIFIASAIFAALISQLTVFSTQILIDNILPNYNLNLLVLFAIGLGIFRTFVLILSLYKSFISIHLSNIFDHYFLSSFGEKLNTLPIRYIHTFSKGDLSERVKDSLSLKKFFTSFFTNIIIDGLITIYSLFILLLISWKITMIVILVLVISIIWFRLLVPYIRENEKRRFLEKSSLFSAMFENIEGLQVIRSLRLEGLFIQRIAPKIKSILDIQKRMKYVNMINSGVLEFIMLISGLVILVLLSKNAITDRSISLGQILTYLTLSRQVFSSVSSILDENLDLQENSIILERYFDFGKAAATPPIPSAQRKIQNFKLQSIAFNNIGFHYVPQRPVFTNLSFSLEKGEKIRLEGSNGAGKSTFCKVLSLLYEPDSGEIRINNEKFGFYQPGALRKKLLLISNEDILFNETLGYNIAFNSDASTADILKLAKAIGFYDFINEKPEGLDFIINEQGRNLSTGQRKKVLMMRALLSEAELIILDETLSGIDKESRKKIEEYINDQTDRSFIIISHEPLPHVRFSKTLIMQNGTINELQHESV